MSSRDLCREAMPGEEERDTEGWRGPPLGARRLGGAGNPAVIGAFPVRPVALRPLLSKGVPLSEDARASSLPRRLSRKPIPRSFMGYPAEHARPAEPGAERAAPAAPGASAGLRGGASSQVMATATAARARGRGPFGRAPTLPWAGLAWRTDRARLVADAQELARGKAAAGWGQLGGRTHSRYESGDSSCLNSPAAPCLAHCSRSGS